jgi:hypothetical protein
MYVHLQWSIVRSGILDPWPGSPGIWPWPDPYQEKYNFTSMTRVPTIRIGHMMARSKGVSVRIIFNFRLLVICACGLLPIRPKSQNSNIRHDGTLSIRNLMLMLKKPMDPNLEPLCSMGSMAMIRSKSQNTNMPWWCSIDQKINTEYGPTNNFSFCQLTNNQKMCSLFPWQHGISYLFQTTYFVSTYLNS